MKRLVETEVEVVEVEEVGVEVVEVLWRRRGGWRLWWMRRW